MSQSRAATARKTPERAPAEEATAGARWGVLGLTALGAAIGAVVGFAYALFEAATQGVPMLVAFSFDVMLAMAIIGGLIAANCAPSDE
jgi:hypothetical protein